MSEDVGNSGSEEHKSEDLSSEIDGLESSVYRLEREIHELNSTIRKLKSKNKILGSKFDDIESQNITLGSMINDVGYQNNILKLDLLQLTRTVRITGFWVFALTIYIFFIQ